MSLLQNEDFAFNDSYKFTQFFRGTLFVFADTLLSYSKPIPEKDILKMGVGNVNPYGDENFRFKRYFTPQQGDQNK